MDHGPPSQRGPTFQFFLMLFFFFFFFFFFFLFFALSDSISFRAMPRAKKITGKQSRLRCSQVLSTSHPAGVAPTKMQHHRSTHEGLRKMQYISSEPPNDAVQKENERWGFPPANYADSTRCRPTCTVAIHVQTKNIEARCRLPAFGALR